MALFLLCGSSGRVVDSVASRKKRKTETKSVNVVFADGSVRALEDNNGDGFVNPGFGVDSSATFQTTGYTSSEVEVNPFDMYSGVLLKGTFPTKAFEQ